MALPKRSIASPSTASCFFGAVNSCFLNFGFFNNKQTKRGQLAAKNEPAGSAIPLLVGWCIQRIEAANDAELAGIYRRHGNWDTVERLLACFRLNDVRQPTASQKLTLANADLASVAGLLKRYLYGSRREPVLLPAHYQYLVHTSLEIKNEQLRALYLSQAIRVLLSSSQYSLCEALFCHLGRLARRCQVTGMTSEQLALSWAPILFHVSSAECQFLELQDAMRALQQEVVVVDTIIKYFDTIFVQNPPQ